MLFFMNAESKVETENELIFRSFCNMYLQN